MNEIYKSRVAKWYVGLCIGMVVAFIATICLCFYTKAYIVLLIDAVLVGVGVWLVFDMLLHTDYTIHGDTLLIRGGVLFRMKLPISNIKEMTHKSTFLSSPALSAKRIGIRYSKRNWVYISPERQEEFITALRSINPDIKVSFSQCPS